MKRRRWKKLSNGFPGEKQLSTLLKGRTAGAALIFGPLEMIPLFGSASEPGIYGPPTHSLEWASSPQLSLHNRASNWGLLPLHLAFVEHGLPGQSLANCQIIGPNETLIIADAASLTLPDAHWHLITRDRLVSLPYMLRASAHAYRGKASPSRLWEPIRQMANALQIPLAGIPTDLRRQWWTQMQAIYAQLPVQKGQTGALILLDGEVIGVELAPDEVFWRDWWRSLCQYTYAPLCMIPAIQKSALVPKPAIAGARSIGSIKSLRAEKEAIFHLQGQKASHILALLATSPVQYELTQHVAAHKVWTLESGPYAGQCVSYEEQPAYLSLFRKDRWQY